MLASQVPANFPIPFANAAGGGYKNTIPQASQIGILAGAASLTDGFPPLNFLPAPPYGSGVPPFGQDMNGIFYEITSSVQWTQAGGMPVYNSAFSTAIGGYPNGAVLLMASGNGMWMSTVDNNLTDPDTSGAGWKILSIAPGAYLDLSVAGAVNVTLTALQAANAVIDMTGAITANIAVIVPTVTGEWTFSNTTTGAFAITVKTAAGTGIVVPQGTAIMLYCDGTNVYGISAATAVNITGVAAIANGGTGQTTAAAALSALGGAALAGLSTQQFSVANASSAAQAVALGQGDARYAALAGLSTQQFSVANASSAAQAVALGQFSATFTAQGAFTVPVSGASAGFQFKWGVSGVIASAAGFTITFPTAFPNACAHANFIATSNNTGVANPNPAIGTLGAGGFSGTNNQNISSQFYWFAIGY